MFAFVRRLDRGDFLNRSSLGLGLLCKFKYRSRSSRPIADLFLGQRLLEIGEARFVSKGTTLAILRTRAISYGTAFPILRSSAVNKGTALSILNIRFVSKGAATSVSRIKKVVPFCMIALDEEKSLSDDSVTGVDKVYLMANGISIKRLF